ncbi:MAG: septation protein SpoVG family protein [Melioribacteraceae bacterium]|nr:septation protein SpoVG family protein [Melioribacteraceae bacterium]
MKISRLNKYDGESKTKAFFDMETEEGIVIKGFTLVEGSNGLFASVPSHKGKDDKYYENVIMSKEQKKELNDLAVTKYNEL